MFAMAQAPACNAATLFDFESLNLDYRGTPVVAHIRAACATEIPQDIRFARSKHCKGIDDKNGQPEALPHRASKKLALTREGEDSYSSTALF